MSNTKGLHFKKFDLHIHTPASKDFRQQDPSNPVEPSDIVNTAIAKGLDGICITDHNTAEWVDKVSEAAKGKPLTVFPGVEISVSGGKEGPIHIVGIFDPKTTTENLNDLLADVGLTAAKRGKTDEIAKGSPNDVINTINGHGGLAVLAHADSTHGVLSDMRGQPRIKVVQDPNLKSAEITKIDTRKFLDGENPDYQRKLAVHQSSDAHSLDEIGNRFSWFKVDENTNIEDLRQCFIDEEVRIKLDSEHQETFYPRIDKLKIIGGFLSDQEFIFHGGLNSILGSKGSGKSLAIEFLRFALNQPPEDKELMADHNLKLEKCLQLHGKLTVEITDASGKKYQVTRSFDGFADPIEIIDPSDGTVKEFQIEQIFPVLFLSQNEIIKIAEDKTGGKQRAFIDNFLNFHKHQQEITEVCAKLKEVDFEFAEAIEAHLRVLDLDRQIKSLQESIDKINRQIKNAVFNEYSKKEKIGRSISSLLDFLSNQEDLLINKIKGYRDLRAPVLDDDVNEDPAVKRATDSVNAALGQIIKSSEEAVAVLKKEKKKIAEEYSAWEEDFQPTREKYDDLVKEAGGEQAQLDLQRKKDMLRLAELQKTRTEKINKSQQLKNIAERRNKLISDLRNARKNYFEAREERSKHFTKSSSGSLDVAIKESNDKTAFRQNLIRFKRGSYLKDEDIDLISENVSPEEFVISLMRYEIKEKKDISLLGPISKKTGLEIENVEKLSRHLLEEFGHKEILGLLYTSTAEDVPVIKYLANGKFKELTDLSVGQKATALLIMALSDGDFPVVIDQPEDSLDLKSIWHDVCKNLRGSKNKRQFILTTHNSSVAVASDSDKFIILESTAKKGSIVRAGSMNRKAIRQDTIDLLEGGETTYDMKRKKYNIRDQK